MSRRHSRLSLLATCALFTAVGLAACEDDKGGTAWAAMSASTGLDRSDEVSSVHELTPGGGR